jgi:hypothetical protein
MADPPPEGLDRAAEFLGDRSNRRPLGWVLTDVVEYHTNRAFTQFGGILAGWCHELDPLSD